MVKKVSHRVVVRNGYEILADPDDSAKIQQHRERMLKFLKQVQSEVEKLSTTYEAQFDVFKKNDTEKPAPIPW